MKRFPLPLAVVVAAAALLALLVYGVVGKQQNTTIDDAVKKGKRVSAPSRTLPVLGTGGKRSLTDFRGQVVVLNFWASWCTPCRAEAPTLESAQRRWHGKGLTILGVSFRDTTDDAQKFVRRHHITFRSVRDIDGKLAHDYGTVALPETFVLDRRGKIVAAFRGQIVPRDLDRTVPRLLRERA